MRDDVWSCLVVLVTFWFFASVTLILGFFGSANTRLGPNCSRLIQSNPFFVQSIKVEEVDEPKPGPILYGFYKPPPLDIEIAWTETHMAFVPANLHKEWIYFLNKGSRVDILYNVKSTSPSPLSLVIAQGRESLIEWIEDPSYPNTTLSWNIISGSGKIQQKISKPSNYYIAVGNLHSEEVEGTDVGWYVKLSFGPRWITYFLGSGIMTILILSAFRFSNTFQTTDENPTGFQAGELGTEQVPLLMHKDDDISSWGSSYDSVSQDDEDPEARLAVNGIEGQQITEGESINNPRCLCVICFDAPRDCFFLPCGHCAACFTCGTRIAEEAGTCPICRRKMKKVRKIFSV
ncbi:hypothetical protein I3760_13G075900 [Carya illinoinensis]|nr:hypothetical protein I3760_13G075900 [Carya illinoinensis]